MNDTAIIEFFSSYAYQPYFVYAFVVGFMLASAVGFPVPEEMTLVSAGLVAHMAKTPDLYPPPYPGAQGVNLFVLCLVCYFAVLGADTLIFYIGKRFDKRIMKTRLFSGPAGKERYDKIIHIFDKYGHLACGIFRFTPGIRFPGHLACGMMGVPVWKFVAIDSFVALISVPTQVYFVAMYGQEILVKLREFKIAVGIILLVLFIGWLVRKIYLWWRSRA